MWDVTGGMGGPPGGAEDDGPDSDDDLPDLDEAEDGDADDVD